MNCDQFMADVVTLIRNGVTSGSLVNREEVMGAIKLATVLGVHCASQGQTDITEEQCEKLQDWVIGIRKTIMPLIEQALFVKECEQKPCVGDES